jgi:hypothetical protein
MPLRSSSPLRGWTGSQRNTPGPSSYPPSRQTTPGAIVNRKAHVEHFSERFKYLVCSSGLLEKDLVTTGNPTNMQPGSEAVSNAPTISEPVVEAEVQSAIRHRPDWGWWLQRSRERWDIVGAAGVLAIGLIHVIGWRAVLCMASLAVGGVITWLLHRTREPVSTRLAKLGHR